ncbi:MAG: galactokinase [Halorhabdus sp.]
MTHDHTHRVVSPGRVNLIGEHTDYTGGYVMPFATDLHTALLATPTDDRAVEIHSRALEDTVTASIDDPEATGTWVDYVMGCYAVLQSEGYDPGGFKGELEGTLPLGAGLSSSASLELAMLAFLEDAYELGIDRERLALLGQRVENEFVGMSCGIMDQFAVALGKSDHALRLDTETLEYRPIPLPEDVQIVVFHTGVEHELVDSAYNQRRDTVETALQTLGLDSAKAVPDEQRQTLPARQAERLGYVTRENDRVVEACNALEAGDIDRFGDILVAAHRDIAEHYEASCDELDFFVETAIEEGAYGARLTGAGWGGSAIAVVDEERASSFAESVFERYTEQFPDRNPSYHLVTAADGVRVENVD